MGGEGWGGSKALLPEGTAIRDKEVLPSEVQHAGSPVEGKKRKAKKKGAGALARSKQKLLAKKEESRQRRLRERELREQERQRQARAEEGSQSEDIADSGTIGGGIKEGGEPGSGNHSNSGNSDGDGNIGVDGGAESMGHKGSGGEELLSSLAKQAFDGAMAVKGTSVSIIGAVVGTARAVMLWCRGAVVPPT